MKYKYFLVISVVLCILGFIVYTMSESEIDPGVEITGEPICISTLFTNKDGVWLLRAKNMDIPQEYDIYHIDNDNREQYIRSYPGKEAHWNNATEKLYYLSENKICEFDYNTGSIKYYSAQKEYTRICAVEKEFVFLQEDLYGAVVKYSIRTDDEIVLQTKGRVLNVQDGYLFTWDIYENMLTCFDYERENIIWEIDLSDKFSSAPILCINEGDLYVGNVDGGYIYVIDQFAVNNVPQKTEVYANVLGIVEANNKVLVASKGSNSIQFCIISDDEHEKTMLKWEVDNKGIVSPILLQVYNDKIFFAFKNEKAIWIYNIEDNN